MKILFIACYSPLINNSAAIETLQYLNNLVKEGNSVELLTVDFPEDCIYYDKKLLSHVDEKVVIHRVDGGKIFNSIIPRKKSDDLNGNANSSFIRKSLRSVKNAFIIPDMYYTWAKNAAKYGSDLINKSKFDIIFSMHEPPSSHLCALYIKRYHKDIPWVTYWSDPWLKDSTRENAFIFKKIIEKRMEAEIVKASDRFIFVTDKNRQDYVKEYGIDESKTFIITRGYDGELYSKLISEQKPELINNDKLNLIYAGEIFSKLRDIKPFINSLKELKEENREAFEKLNVLFFGNIDDNESRQELILLGNVKVSGRIPYNDALKYMLFSQGLLLFGNKNSKQIPAKIYDYLGACGKIITIYGDENDPIKQIVSNNKKCINTLNDKDEIKKVLLELIHLYDIKEINEKPDVRYEWCNISKKLNSIISGV